MEIEESFIRKYIKKQRRDRIYYELTNTKKRKDAIGRFCHNAEDFLDRRKITYQGTDMAEGIELINRFSEKECYTISWDDEIDGGVYPALEAIDKINAVGMASIAIFENFCIVKTEQEQGPAEIFLLI